MSAFIYCVQGYIIQKREAKATGKTAADGASANDDDALLTYSEFHPMLFAQHAHLPHVTFASFNKCVDEFFSKLGSQKLDMKVLQQVVTLQQLCVT